MSTKNKRQTAQCRQTVKQISYFYEPKNQGKDEFCVMNSKV